MFCSKCGKEVHDDAVVCVNCGCQIKPAANANAKSWVATLLLCLFLGSIGAHRFYTGHIGTAIVQLLTLGGCGIWTLIDLIMIICKNFKTANGEELA